MAVSLTGRSRDITTWAMTCGGSDSGKRRRWYYRRSTAAEENSLTAALAT
nr:hypothetical protein [uncultured bacterium]